MIREIAVIQPFLHERDGVAHGLHIPGGVFVHALVDFFLAHECVQDGAQEVHVVVPAAVKAVGQAVIAVFHRNLQAFGQLFNGLGGFQSQLVEQRLVVIQAHGFHFVAHAPDETVSGGNILAGGNELVVPAVLFVSVVQVEQIARLHIVAVVADAGFAVDHVRAVAAHEGGLQRFAQNVGRFHNALDRNVRMFRHEQIVHLLDRFVIGFGRQRIPEDELDFFFGACAESQQGQRHRQAQHNGQQFFHFFFLHLFCRVKISLSGYDPAFRKRSPPFSSFSYRPLNFSASRSKRLHTSSSGRYSGCSFR